MGFFMSLVPTERSYYEFEEIVKILPLDNQKYALGKLNSKNLVLHEDTGYFKKTNIIAMIVSQLGAIAGICLLLAAQRVLPHGAKAISQLGIWGTVGGAALIGSGAVILIIAVISVISLVKREKYNKEMQDTRDNVKYNALEGEMDSGIFSDALKKNEIFIVIGKAYFTVYMLPERGKIKSYIKYPLTENERPCDLVKKTLENTTLYQNGILVSKEDLQKRLEA